LFWDGYPALTRWANVWRASGAGDWNVEGGCQRVDVNWKKKRNEEQKKKISPNAQEKAGMQHLQESVAITDLGKSEA
jgi:hypothetical protein